MVLRLAASLTVGAVIRTNWQPTATNSRVCRTHSAVSMVSQVSIDWTTTGWPPPMITPPRAGSPTTTSRVTRRDEKKRGYGVMHLGGVSGCPRFRARI